MIINVIATGISIILGFVCLAFLQNETKLNKWYDYIPTIWVTGIIIYAIWK